MTSLKTTEEGIIQEATVSPADAVELSVASVVAAVLSEVDCINALKEEHRMALEAFLCGQDVFTLPPTLFGKNITANVAHHLNRKP